MNTWYKFIMSAFFSKDKEKKELEMIDKKEEVLSGYIELDSLMQVIYSVKETDADN